MESTVMDVYDAIRGRNSVRTYADQDVPDHVILRLLEAARLAPSAGNRQEWRFVVVRDKETRDKLAHAAKRQLFVGFAPVVIAACAQTDGHVMACGQLSYPVSVSLAVANLMLCATAEGLGTCWVGAFSEDRVRDILAIPAGVRVLALITLGYPESGTPVRKTRIPFDRIVRFEQWRSLP